MSANTEALQFKCTKCGAKPGAGCVYMATATKTEYHFDIERGRHVPVQVYAQVEGQPTKRPHNQRLHKVYERKRALEQASWFAKRTEELRDRFAEERRAYASAVLKEHDDLKTWLRRYGSVLWQT